MTDTTVRAVGLGHVVLVAAVLAGFASGGFPPSEMWDSPWGVPFLVANLGIVAGNVAMLFLASRPDAAARVALEARREDLEDNRHLVVEQLRALEAERDKLAPDDYARERAELLAVGTEASRALETTHEAVAVAGAPTVVNASTSPAGAPPTMGPVDALALRLQMEREADPETFDAALKKLGVAPRGSAEAWRGAGYALAVVALAGGFYALADGASRDRAPGMSMTGGDQVMAANEMPVPPAPPEVVAELGGLQARLESDPRDVAALNRYTELAIGQGDLATALTMSDRAIAIDPKDPDARTMRAILVANAMGLERGLDEIDAVLLDHPQHHRALVIGGLMAMQREATADRAVVLLERALALQDSPELRQALEQARAAATPAEVLVAGTIDLAEGTRDSGAVVYVSLRPQGATAGPPVAVRRLAPGPFPLAFSVTSKDLMLPGTPIPEGFDVTLTLDADGDPISKDPSDPTAALPGVLRGTKGLEVELR